MLASAPFYADRFDDYIGFLRPRMIEAHRILTPTGSLFFHIARIAEAFDITTEGYSPPSALRMLRPG